MFPSANITLIKLAVENRARETGVTVVASVLQRIATGALVIATPIMRPITFKL
jgi:hypothetical protein